MSYPALVQELKARGVIKSSEILQSFLKINRQDFVLPQYSSQAYEDIPLPIGYGQTISQPLTVGFMLELLKPMLGNKILDVGSGSGWTSALLSVVVGNKGRIIGVERIPELVTFGKHNIEKYNLTNVDIFPAISTLGFKEFAPYDRILVSAAAKTIPEELICQLNDHGIMVIPVGDTIFQIKKHKGGKIEKKGFFGFTFVPLIDQE